VRSVTGYLGQPADPAKTPLAGQPIYPAISWTEGARRKHFPPLSGFLLDYSASHCLQVSACHDHFPQRLSENRALQIYKKCFHTQYKPSLR
jgi:hypothetical protein